MSKVDLAIVDCQMSNIHSVYKAMLRVAPHWRIVVSAERQEIANADRILFPGDGSFAAGIEQLQKLDLVDILKQAAREKPFLGICLGMQVLYESSEEAPGTPGLGCLPGSICRLQTPNVQTQQSQIKIPHIGWNKLSHLQHHAILDDTLEPLVVYFLHSYACSLSEETLMSCEHGQNVFSAIVAKDNLIATQFHPEKSGKVGLQLLANFVKLADRTHH